MAGSRREAVGSIFKRIQGLLRSGAIKEEDRPIWYDVVKAFPPKPVPPPTKVQKILYPEDHVRVQFHRVYSSKGLTSLSDEFFKSVPDKFVDTYMELHKRQLVPPDQLFEMTAKTLTKQGIRLFRHDEIPLRKPTSPTEGNKITRSKPIELEDDFFSDKT